MTTSEQRLVRFIEKRLKQFLATPEMWGSDESVELQVIQLLEIRLLLLTGSTNFAQADQIMQQYLRFLARQFPNNPPEPLPLLLARHGRGEEFKNILNQFVDQEQYRPQELAREIHSRETDGLKVRLASSETAQGSIPLGTAAHMLYGLRSLLVATARMEAEPAPSHRTTRKRETEFGDFCRLGQTELGSFVINIEVPLFFDWSNNSFSRKVTQRIMRGLEIVTQVQKPEDLVRAYPDGMNANMLEAMLMLRPDTPNFQINIASEFTKQIPLSHPVPDEVEIRAHNFDVMEEGARQLRELDAPKELSYRGRVRTLVSNTGQVNIDVVDGDKRYQLRTYLTGIDYWNAVHAHEKKLDVIMTGKLRFHGPQRWIDEVVKFQIIQNQKGQ